MTIPNLLIAFVAELLLFLPTLMLSFRLFDELLRMQFSDAHQEWEQYGCPSGYFWKPLGSQPMSLRKRGDLWSHWYWYPPVWSSRSDKSQKIYSRFKLIGRLAIVTFVPVFGACCLLSVLAVVTGVTLLSEYILR